MLFPVVCLTPTVIKPVIILHRESIFLIKSSHLCIRIAEHNTLRSKLINVWRFHKLISVTAQNGTQIIHNYKQDVHAIYEETELGIHWHSLQLPSAGYRKVA